MMLQQSLLLLVQNGRFPHSITSHRSPGKNTQEHKNNRTERIGERDAENTDMNTLAPGIRIKASPIKQML